MARTFRRRTSRIRDLFRDFDRIESCEIGIYQDVYTELGHGFVERIYQQAMVIALGDAGLSVVERVPFLVLFRGQLLGEFFADIVVNDVVLLDSVPSVPSVAGRQRGGCPRRPRRPWL